MIFIIKGTKYDTDKMKKVANVKKSGTEYTIFFHTLYTESKK